MRKSRMLLAATLLMAAGAYIVVAGQSELKRIAVPLPAAAPGAPGAARVDSAQLLGDVRTLASAEFGGRRTGTEGSRKAQAFLQARFEALGLRPFGGAFAEPFAFTHKSIKGLLTPGKAYKTEYPKSVNYIGFIPGSATDARYIVVSAHYDHLGEKAGKLYPGADDNASGVAAMLAIAKWFKAHPPRHSIVFAAFDGEELGLQGARAFLAALPFPKARLALNLNLDMVSHNDSNEIYAAGTSYTPALTPLVAQAAARNTVKVKLGHDRSQLVAGSVEDWTGSSDHGPFHDAGVPFLYFGVEDHDDYHAPSDTFERINQKFFVDVANLLVDVAETADRNLR
ncbi:M20/M25/M40 family metallo-hydrolase [Massilia sp. R2A-15]|uniref:M20/M25/M40 family metallo-hydrolase n=1 Tax=Massilia sp. R2A-15 TaxID=3064278 RepID=UPI0027361621|nr:M20/M25/M40 family metallo-hydrolase [Massilia sp. R2A-15]WLI88684.1 M20/M25/M40 family metallo-hydrolase [Massilia sp. R2A-15]